jgi:cytosine/uracil/thiamine/allantoin permease
MKRAPIVIGLVLLLVGIVWAAQGAGVAPGNSFMNNNPTYLNLGGVLAAVGAVLIGLGAVWKTKVKAPG